MSTKEKTDSWKRAEAVDRAFTHLKLARAALKYANAPQTLRRVRSAIKSCEGARRHAGLRNVRGAVLEHQARNAALEQPDKVLSEREPVLDRVTGCPGCPDCVSDS